VGTSQAGADSVRQIFEIVHCLAVVVNFSKNLSVNGGKSVGVVPGRPRQTGARSGKHQRYGDGGNEENHSTSVHCFSFELHLLLPCRLFDLPAVCFGRGNGRTPRGAG